MTSGVNIQDNLYPALVNSSDGLVHPLSNQRMLKDNLCLLIDTWTPQTRKTMQDVWRPTTDPHRVLILNSSCCAYWSLQILLIMIHFDFDTMTVWITLNYDDIDWRKDAKRLGWLLTSVLVDTEAPNDDGLYSMVMSVDSRGGKTTRLFKTCIAPIDRKCSVS